MYQAVKFVARILNTQKIMQCIVQNIVEVEAIIMKTLTILLAIVLIILIYYQYYYMQTDWCSAEIDILKSQISDIWYMYNLDMEVINE